MLLGGVLLGQLVTMPFAALSLWTNPLVLEFLIGAAIALVFQRGVVLPAWVRAGLILSAVGMLSLYGDPIASPIPQFAPWRWVQWGIPAAAIVAGSVLGSQRWLQGRFGRIASLLGDASYSLYLLHILVLHFFLPPVFAQQQPLYLVAGFVVAVGLSLVSYRYFERPITNLLKKPTRVSNPLPATA